MPRVRREARPDPRQTVVDVGCGTGSLLRIVREHQPGTRVIGVDGSAEMIAVAQEQTANDTVEYHAADAAELPLDDGCADLVLLLNSLHHFPQPGAALAEAMRILKPGGTVWVGTDEDVYDMAGWSNGRVRDELRGASGIRQTVAIRATSTNCCHVRALSPRRAEASCSPLTTVPRSRCSARPPCKGAVLDHAGHVDVRPIPDFDLDRTIFQTLEGALPRMVMAARVGKDVRGGSLRHRGGR